MNAVRLDAHAKLNLTLDVLGKREGYHEIDSLAVTIDLCDRIVARVRKDGRVNVAMHGMGSESIPPEKNNALLAGEKLTERFSLKGADVTIYKNIPVGGGLGGSSADAAGVLLALASLNGFSDMGALKSVADETGSDTGYLLTGGLARLTGRGETVRRLPMTPELNFLLLIPPEGVLAGDCYAMYDRQEPSCAGRTERALAELERGNLAWAARSFGNGLFPAAAKLYPPVEEALSEARSFSPLGASMTGSGSCVFALFQTPELAAWAKSRYRGRCRAVTARGFYGGKGAKNPFVLSENEINGG